MSIYNHLLLHKTPQGNKINPAGLFVNGPILNVVISLPKPLVELYTKEGKNLPQPKTGIALVDTGATKSCIHNTIMKDLKVNSTGIIVSHTANGAKECNVYPAHFSFPEARIEVELTSVVEVDLTGQYFDNKQIIALIGRDVLSNSVFIYNGPLGLYTLTV